ncbi:MAG: hypothetical protein LBV55_01015 [Acholeplasmatales bacterium]|jgi:ABC-type transport system involved in multi-copper enzyme maturation permease subunit|nr:hypothetical protein [Acholeplasmatales bacterium]
MKSLIALEFRRLIKDKTMIIGSIIFLVISVAMSYLLGYVNQNFSGTSLNYGLVSISFFSYSPILIMIFMATFLTKDFASGTIRNKIVAGYSRSKIYFSSLIVCLATLGTLFVTSFLITTLLSFTQGIDFSDSKNFLFIIFYFGQIIFVTSFIHFVSFSVKSIGGAIGIIIGGILGVVYLTYVLMILSSSIDNNSVIVFIVQLIRFLPQGQNTIVTFPILNNLLEMISDIEVFSANSLIYYISIDLAFSAIFIVGGNFIFLKADLK